MIVLLLLTTGPSHPGLADPLTITLPILARPVRKTNRATIHHSFSPSAAGQTPS